MGITKQQLVMVVTLLLGALMVVLNQTLLSPTLPVIMADLQVDATTVQWLTSGYSLMEAVVIPLSAYFIGRFSTRKLFLGGLLLFVVASVLAAVAPVFPVLLAGRMLQATAAGVVMPMVFTVIMLTFPIEQRGSAMGIVGLVMSFAPAIGPSVGGLLADTVGWRVLFVLVACLTALIVVVALFTLKNREGFERTTFDVPSVILSTIGMVCVLYGFSTFASSENVIVPVALVLVGAAVIGLFVYRQTKLEVPLLKVEVLLTRRYRTAVILVFVFQCALVGSGVVLPIYLQNVLGQSATVSGLVMLPGAVVGAVCGVLAGRLFDKHGIRGLALFGGGVMTVASFGVCFFDVSTPILFVAAVYTFIVIGLQFLMTPINTWGVNSLDNRVIQHANAVSNTLNQVGASFGTALIVSLSALGRFAAPEATGRDLIMAGDHISFCAMFALLFVVFAIIVVAVRDKKTDVDPRKVFAPEGGLQHAAERTWVVKDVMNPAATAIMADATIAQAVAKLSKFNTSGLVVVDHQGKPVGFLSDGDIMNGIAREEKSFNDGVNLMVLIDDRKLQDKVALMLEKNVMSIATKKVVSVDADFALEAAAKVLAEKRIKKLPVLDGGRLVGMLSRRDIINAMARVNRLADEE